MSGIAYALVGIVWALMFADAALTLDGLRSGKVVEKNRLMRWFVKSRWRIYPFTAAVCAVLYALVWFVTSAGGWWWAVIVCVPLIVQRVIVVRKNYRLNVWAL